MAETGPKLLGVVLDATVTGMLNVDKVKLRASPRMADFAEWAIACSEVLGWEPEEFVLSYVAARLETQSEMAETSQLMRAVKQLVKDNPWDGTATELLNTLNAAWHITPGFEPDDWPRKAQLVGTAIRRIVEPARTLSIDIKFKRKGGKNLISIRKQEAPQSDLTSQPTQSLHKEIDIGVSCVPYVSFLEKRVLYRSIIEDIGSIKKNSPEKKPTQDTQGPLISDLPTPESEAYTNISLHQKVIYILKHVDAFVGIDGRTYGPFKPDEVVSMPEAHAINLQDKAFGRMVSGNNH